MLKLARTLHDVADREIQYVSLETSGCVAELQLLLTFLRLLGRVSIIHPDKADISSRHRVTVLVSDSATKIEPPVSKHISQMGKNMA